MMVIVSAKGLKLVRGVISQILNILDIEST